MWQDVQIALPWFDFRRKLPSELLCALWQLAHSMVAVPAEEPNSGSGFVVPTVILGPLATCVTYSAGVAARAV